MGQLQGILIKIYSANIKQLGTQNSHFFMAANKNLYYCFSVEELFSWIWQLNFFMNQHAAIFKREIKGVSFHTMFTSSCMVIAKNCLFQFKGIKVTVGIFVKQFLKELRQKPTMAPILQTFLIERNETNGKNAPNTLTSCTLSFVEVNASIIFKHLQFIFIFIMQIFFINFYCTQHTCNCL